MTKAPINTANKLHGTYEIDETGKISYFFSASGENETNHLMIGKNFYDFLQSVLINDELPGKIKVFAAGSASTDGFDIEYAADGLRQKALVLLARIRGRKDDGKQDLIVIDIKPEPKA